MLVLNETDMTWQVHAVVGNWWRGDITYHSSGTTWHCQQSPGEGHSGVGHWIQVWPQRRCLNLVFGRESSHIEWFQQCHIITKAGQSLHNKQWHSFQLSFTTVLPFKYHYMLFVSLLWSYGALVCDWKIDQKYTLDSVIIIVLYSIGRELQSIMVNYHCKKSCLTGWSVYKLLISHCPCWEVV